MAALTACTSDSKRPSAVASSASSSTATPAPAAPRRPGERPDPSKPEGTDTLPQIEHVIVLMMENHSYDNYLGMLGRGDGFSPAPTADRPTRTAMRTANRCAFHMANTCSSRQPSQSWSAIARQYADGTNDGLRAQRQRPGRMGYWTGDDIPFYYGLANTFPVCDRWFGPCSRRPFPTGGSCWPGPRSATINNDPASSPTDRSRRTARSWTLLNRNDPVARLLHLAAVESGCTCRSSSRTPTRSSRSSQYFTDAAAGTLPAF